MPAMPLATSVHRIQARKNRPKIAATHGQQLRNRVDDPATAVQAIGGGFLAGGAFRGGQGVHQLPSLRESCISMKRAIASTMKVTMNSTKPSSSSAER